VNIHTVLATGISKGFLVDPADPFRRSLQSLDREATRSLDREATGSIGVPLGL